MLKGIIMAAALFGATTVFANTDINSVLLQVQSNLRAEAIQKGMDWKVGDTNKYNLDMGFIKGTMVMSVASIGDEGTWMNQDVDLMGQKQQIKTLLGPDGSVVKTIVNGKEQQMPKPNLEMIEMTDDKVTVPAGTFDCIHARIKDKDKNEEINIWSSQKVAISGMVKTIQPSQLGNVTIELTSTQKAN